MSLYGSVVSVVVASPSQSSCKAKWPLHKCVHEKCINSFCLLSDLKNGSGEGLGAGGCLEACVCTCSFTPQSLGWNVFVRMFCLQTT